MACYNTSASLNYRTPNGLQPLAVAKPSLGTNPLMINRRAIQQLHTIMVKRDIDSATKSAWFQINKITSRHLRVTRVPLPALSPTMESGSIVSWDKKEGDQLNEGDLLAEIETDKATMAFETPEEGFLAKILVPAGTKGVPLGQPLCIIVESEDDVEKFKNFSIEQAIAAAGGDDAPAPPSTATAAAAEPVVAATPPPPPPPPQQQQQQPQQAQPPTRQSQTTFASPLAKKLAKQMGLELPNQGSGPNGRVVASDLAKAASAPSITSSSGGSKYVDIPLTGMRQTIAKRLTSSKQEIPHYYLTVNINVDELLKLRKQFIQKQDLKLSLNDFIIKAAALACKKVPQVNSAWHGDFIRQYKNVDVSVAVSTDSGLITPIVFDAETKGIQEIGTEVKGLAEKARSGKLQPHEFQGGTFTISNLGMFDISHFTAVINPPQSAILAVGTTQQVLHPSTDEEKFRIVNNLNVTLSCDHRVVDGAVGAQWLQWFRKYMEDPFLMLL